MNTLDIAKQTNKNHGHILRDVRIVCEYLGLNPNDYEDVYLDKRGRERMLYNISEPIRVALMDRYDAKRCATKGMKENIALATLEQALNIKLERQYRVLHYRIDGYDPINNIAYEIDEEQHAYTSKKDKIREEAIIKELNCKFVRISL